MSACSRKDAAIPTPSFLPSDQSVLETAMVPFSMAETSMPLPEKLFIELMGEGALQQAEMISQIDANTFAWIPGRSGILATSADDNIMVLGIDTPMAMLRLDTADPSLLTVSPVQENIAWVSQGDTIYIWNTAGEQLPYSLQRDSAVTGLAFSPLGGTLATTSFDGGLEFIQVNSGQVVESWDMPNWLADLAYSPDGKMLAGVDQPNFAVYILDAASGEVLRTLHWEQAISPDLYGAYFSPDWRLLAWVSRGTVQIMDVGSAELGVALQHEDSISAFAWSSDRNLLSTACAVTVDGILSPAVQIWDAVTGQRLGMIVQPQPVQKLSFSDDGKDLGVLYLDGTIQIWTVLP